MAVALSSLFSMPNSHVGIPQTFRRTLPFSGNWRERRTRSDQRCIANLFASPSMNSMATSSKREGRERKGIIHLTNQANSQSALCRHRVWPIPSGPADVLGRDVVGGASEPTADAFEQVPGGTVTLLDVAASGASTAGVPWVDRGHWNAGEPVASRVEVADGFEESGKLLAEFQPRRPSDLRIRAVHLDEPGQAVDHARPER